MVEGQGSSSREVFRSRGLVKGFEAFDYVPDGEEFLGEYYNLWRRGEVDHRPGNASWFEEHMAFVVPDDRERAALMDYLAFLVQRPGEEVMWVPVIQGGQGIGKSWIGHLMGVILGPSKVNRSSNDELTSKWGEDRHIRRVSHLIAIPCN